MKIIVQKFGGSSLKDLSGRLQAVRHIKAAYEQGYGVVVVVSAMGRKGDPYATDTLLEWLQNNGNTLSLRERDLLLTCGEIISSVTMASLLHAHGIPAIALTGGQAGIITDERFTEAEIVSVNPQPIKQRLAENKVVVVCGFQGTSIGGELTTLGRGGSDTTATALGAALDAEYVDIFTDVDGLMTADPRIVKDASFLHWVTYHEICNLAHEGASIIHPRAVELAMQKSTPLRIRSTMSNSQGTVVTTEARMKELTHHPEKRVITGITQKANLTQLKVTSDTPQFDLHVKVFKAMAENRISVDFISVNPLGVIYTVFDHLAEQAISILKGMGYHPEVCHHCAKVAAVGAGMAGVPGVMAMIAEALTEEDIPILQSADSHTTIWLLVRGEDMVRTVNALHRKFNLHKLAAHK